MTDQKDQKQLSIYQSDENGLRSDRHMIVVPGEGTSIVTSGEMRVIRRENPFLDKLGSIMEDPDFRSFFNEYFKDWGDAKAVLMIMYTYNYMDELYYEKIGKRLSSDELVYLIKKMLHLGDTRRIMVEAIQGMMHQEGKFRDQIEKLMISNFSEMNFICVDDQTNNK